jgi:hypothetical protein
VTLDHRGEHREEGDAPLFTIDRATRDEQRGSSAGRHAGPEAVLRFWCRSKWCRLPERQPGDGDDEFDDNALV